jgi:DNA-binding NarL/FixJ family response regulator
MCIESLCAALDGPDLVIDTMTTDRDELLELVGRRRPDVCLIDSTAPDPAGLAVMDAIMRRVPETGIVALVNDPPAAFVHDALAAGVRGFAREDGTLRALRQAIERVADGQRLVGVDTLLPAGPEPSRRMSPFAVVDQLTPRESEVLERMIAGYDTPHIATMLDISRSTARTHVQNVRKKLGAHTRLQAVTLAVGHRQRRPEIPIPRRASLAG